MRSTRLDQASPPRGPDRPGGDGTAGSDFETFAGRERRALLAFAWSLTGDRAAAEDLTQDALETAWRHWDRVQGYDRPGAWARRVVANKATDRGRRRGREARALQRLDGLSGGDGAAARDLDLAPPDAHFWSAVRALPARQAQVVALHYLEDRSVADIAAVLEISEGAVKSHLHRGRVALTRSLGLTQETHR